MSRPERPLKGGDSIQIVYTAPILQGEFWLEPRDLKLVQWAIRMALRLIALKRGAILEFPRGIRAERGPNETL